MTTAAGLPHDSDAECAVVGGILVVGNNGLEDALRTGMDFADFYDERLRLIIRACLKVIEHNCIIDLITVKSVLAESGELEKIGCEYLAGLTSGIPLVLNIGAHAQIVRRKAIATGDKCNPKFSRSDAIV
jgi:replicative DNA helicase